MAKTNEVASEVKLPNPATLPDGDEWTVKDTGKVWVVSKGAWKPKSAAPATPPSPPPPAREESTEAHDEGPDESGDVKMAKVQGKDAYLVYVDDEMVGSVAKPKGADKWQVQLYGRTHEMRHTSGTAAKAYVFGFFEAPKHAGSN